MLPASPSCVRCPPSVCVVVPLNGGSGVWSCCPLVSCCPRPLHSVPCLRIRSGTLHCPVSLVLHSLVLCCPPPLCVRCHSIVGLWCVFVAGLCHCGIAVAVMLGRRACGIYCLLSTLYVLWCVCCLVVLWNGGGMCVCEGCVVSLLVLSSSSLCLPLPLCVGVRGSARAALRARTLSPNTIVSLLLLVLSSSLPPRLSSCPAFLSFGVAVCDSPCVGMLCWHDSNRESVSFVLVFPVVACSSFTVPPVAASAVAFGAEYSPVVWVIGSA